MSFFRKESISKYNNFTQIGVNFYKYFKIILILFIFSLVYISGAYAQQEDLSIWLWNSNQSNNTIIHVGDILELEIWMNVGSLSIQGVSFYITFNDTYFEPVNLKGNDMVFKPFDFDGGIFPPGNITANDALVDSFNAIPGFQLDGGKIFGENVVSGKGKIARFQLKAIDRVDSTKITIDYDRGNHRDTRYHYIISLNDPPSHPFNFRHDFTAKIDGIETAAEKDDFKLLQNFPNPFNPETNISFQLPNPSEVTMKIYDILGREIKTIINANLDVGSHSVKWDGTNNVGLNVGSGVYIYIIKANNFIDRKKMILLR